MRGKAAKWRTRACNICPVGPCNASIRSVLLAGTGSALIFPAPTRAWSSAQVAAAHCKPCRRRLVRACVCVQEHSPPDRHSARGHTSATTTLATFVSWELFLSIRRVERHTFQHRHCFRHIAGVWIAHRLLGSASLLSFSCDLAKNSASSKSRPDRRLCLTILQQLHSCQTVQKAGRASLRPFKFDRELCSRPRPVPFPPFLHR